MATETLAYPERHRDGFEVHRVRGVTHRNSDYTVFQIRKSVAPPQLHDWEAWIPDNMEECVEWQSWDEEYRRHVVLVKGPSQDYYHNRSHHQHGAIPVLCKLCDTIYTYPGMCKLCDTIYTTSGLYPRVTCVTKNGDTFGDLTKVKLCRA